MQAGLANKQLFSFVFATSVSVVKLHALVSRAPCPAERDDFRSHAGLVQLLPVSRMGR